MLRNMRVVRNGAYQSPTAPMRPVALGHYRDLQLAPEQLVAGSGTG